MRGLFASYFRSARGEGSSLPFWWLLRPAGWLYGLIARLRNALFDRGVLRTDDAPIPVISVGNLCSGGTNKTPTVEMIARHLIRRGLKVGIVSRGYGGDTTSPLEVSPASDSADVGDEPRMLASRLPEAHVVVSRDRLAGVRLLAELGAEIAVADDAFQHRRMARDADIVLVDATCPFGSGRIVPAGIMREPKESLRRADIVLLTKCEQASESELEELRSTLEEFVPRERIFEARMEQDLWLEVVDGQARDLNLEWGKPAPDGKFLLFCAIGSPDSFERMLRLKGVEVVRSIAFRDHHKYSWADLDRLERAAASSGATAFVCTEKDIQNMPHDPLFVLPVYVPRISVEVSSPDRFWAALADLIRPHIAVTSNGYGEDSIGALIASELRRKFPTAEVDAFALVGSGKEYASRGFRVISPPSDKPSGGVVKYSFSALIRDMRHGLGRDIKMQLAAWRATRGRYRTPICVGDVYLLLLTLWGQGMTPVLVATAKSSLTRGHFRMEKFLLRKRSRAVWTRDAATAEDLARHGISAIFAGSPIMDLALEADLGGDPWGSSPRPRVLLLPGSRPRAYDDIKLLIDAVRMISSRRECSFLLVLAPTIDRSRMIEASSCELDGDALIAGGARIVLSSAPIATAARGADILIGLGGTANQVSAGMGVPVISILEKGKLAQKRLLRDAELLVPADAEHLCDAACDLLDDEERMKAMSRAGVEMLGGPGAARAVVEYAARELGWEAREAAYAALIDDGASEQDEDDDDAQIQEDPKNDREDAREIGGEDGWQETPLVMTAERKAKVARLARIARALPWDRR